MVTNHDLINEILIELQDSQHKLNKTPLPSKVNIWGIAEAGQRCLRLLEDNSIEVERVFDSNPDKIGTEWNGYKVSPLEDSDSLTIMCAYNSHKAMRGSKLTNAIDIWYFLKTYEFTSYHEWNCFYPNLEHLEQSLHIYVGLLQKCVDEFSRNELIRILRARYGLLDDADYDLSPHLEFCHYDYWVDESENWRIIDAGAFDGDTATRFRNFGQLKGKEVSVLCLEPDVINFGRLVRNQINTPGIILMNASLGDYSTFNAWEAAGGVTSQQLKGQNENSRTNSIVAKTTLDDLSPIFYPTHVKMDIEGFEFAALKGGKSLIQAGKTSFILSIYHKVEDLVSLPGLFDDRYLLGFSSHAQRPWDSTMYVIPKKLVG